MKSYTSLSALFRDVGLSICKKYKTVGLSSITPLDFASKVDSIQTTADIPLGEVKDLRFSLLDGKLVVAWNDPFDVVKDGVTLAYFYMTQLVAKLDEWPQTHEDGIVLHSSTARDAHSLTPLTVDLDALDLVQDGHETCFSFFSQSMAGAWNEGDLLLEANRFSSLSYDWSMVWSALKDYPTSKSLSILPAEGDYVYLDYIVRDYYLSNGINVAADTRNAVVNNIDSISSVSIPWKVLAYNANVPEYVGYKRYDSSAGQHDYVFVKSVDDTLSTAACYNADGTTSTLAFECGDNQFRSISAGCRVYTEDEWDYQTNIKSFTDTGLTVEAVSETVFSYDNDGNGKQYIYSVPQVLSVDGKEYTFCGYTMTLQPQYELISIERTSNTATATYNSIQFDALESTYASPYQSFPDDAADESRYFAVESDGIHEIGWSLSASTQVNSLDYDVYKLDSGRLELQTSYFQKYHAYKLLSADSSGTTVYQPLVEVLDFQLSTPYYTTCEAKNYDKANRNLSVVADIVRYNGNLYVCKANVSATNTKTPDQLTANFRALSSAAELSVQALYEQGFYFVPGQKMPLTMSGCAIVEMNMVNCNSYGKNLYEESFYKQYCNNINGSRTSTDSPYKKMSIFDNVSTVNLANANSLMLKLYKEQQFIRHIGRTVNRTVLSPINGPFRKMYLEHNRQTWETSIDLFYPLSWYELFGQGADASSQFATAYPDNTSRIKFPMTAAGEQSTSALNWWMRYPYTGYSRTEYNVNTSGAQSSINASISYGFAPACTIT